MVRHVPKPSESGPSFVDAGADCTATWESVVSWFRQRTKLALWMKGSKSQQCLVLFLCGFFLLFLSGGGFFLLSGHDPISLNHVRPSLHTGRCCTGNPPRSGRDNHIKPRRQADGRCACHAGCAERLCTRRSRTHPDRRGRRHSSRVGYFQSDRARGATLFCWTHTRLGISSEQCPTGHFENLSFGQQQQGTNSDVAVQW